MGEVKVCGAGYWVRVRRLSYFKIVLSYLEPAPPICTANLGRERRSLLVLETPLSLLLAMKPVSSLNKLEYLSEGLCDSLVMVVRDQT